LAERFGTEITMLGVSVRGELSIEDARAFAIECVNCIGMQISHPAHVVEYPLHNGENIGFMLLQPLIESYVILDVWTNLKGFYLGVASCKDFNSTDVENLIDKWGFRRMSISGGYLNL